MTERAAPRSRSGPTPEPRPDRTDQGRRLRSVDPAPPSRFDRHSASDSVLPPLPPETPRRARARRVVDSDVAPSPTLPSLDDLPRRRLSDDERLALRDRRRTARPPAVGNDDGRTGPGRRRAPAADVTFGGATPVDEWGATSPDRSIAPGRERDRAGTRTVTLGALLFIGLVAVTFGAGGLFVAGGSADPTPTPTVAPTVIAPLSAPPETPTPNASPTVAEAAAARWPGDGDDRTVVCLDPGHGGWDLGYTRFSAAGLPAMAEADYNLAQAYDLAARLRERGFVVVMTRRTPNAVNAAGADVNGDGRTFADSERAGELDELQARIDVCNEADADLLVSMHVNGYDARPAASGYETWYTGTRSFGDQSARFATLAFRALGEEMGAVGYEAVAREVNNDEEVSIDRSDSRLLSHMIMTGPEQRGIERPSNMPGAIVECLFISNDADAAFLASPEGHEAIVTAYEAAIVQYFAEFPG